MTGCRKEEAERILAPGSGLQEQLDDARLRGYIFEVVWFGRKADGSIQSTGNSSSRTSCATRQNTDTDSVDTTSLMIVIRAGLELRKKP